MIDERTQFLKGEADIMNDRQIRESRAVRRPTTLRVCRLLTLLCGLAPVIACAPDEPPAPPAPTVIAEPVQRRTIPLYTDYVGRTEASKSVEVRARVDGFLERRAFREGSLVAQGDLLFVIDPKPYEARVRQLDAQVQRCEATLAKTERDVDRLAPLFERNAASRLDYDNALSAREEAEADLESAVAAVEQARLELSYTRITAPLTGLAGARKVSIGTLVGSKGASLLTVVQQVDPMWVTFNMTAEEYLEVRRKLSREAPPDDEPVEVGSLINIRLPDGSRYEHSGGIDFTDPAINPRTGTFQVRAEIPNPDRFLLPGQYVRVSLLRDMRVGALLIPEKAKMIEQGGAYVFVVLADGTAERRFVEIGSRYASSIVIEQGLAAGELVVVEGMHKIQHGQQVKVVDEPPDGETSNQPTNGEAS
ncbi:MAG: efflux RND transporter periplasmic adaptor subunit [Thermoanaerobaculales bacterium]|nr:efflux RND transporter periplasmic adaptor subunit [Thermoanaerobaculales bacterium]